MKIQEQIAGYLADEIAKAEQEYEEKGDERARGRGFALGHALAHLRAMPDDDARFVGLSAMFHEGEEFVPGKGVRAHVSQARFPSMQSAEFFVQLLLQDVASDRRDQVSGGGRS